MHSADGYANLNTGVLVDGATPQGAFNTICKKQPNDYMKSNSARYTTMRTVYRYASYSILLSDTTTVLQAQQPNTTRTHW